MFERILSETITILLIIAGKIGISLQSNWFEPKRPTHPGDIAAHKRRTEHTLGLFAYPIFVSGDYSPMLRNMTEKNVSKPGTILPLFTEYEKFMIKGEFYVLYRKNEIIKQMIKAS